MSADSTCDDITHCNFFDSLESDTDSEWSHSHSVRSVGPEFFDKTKQRPTDERVCAVAKARKHRVTFWSTSDKYVYPTTDDVEIIPESFHKFVVTRDNWQWFDHHTPWIYKQQPYDQRWQVVANPRQGLTPRLHLRCNKKSW